MEIQNRIDFNNKTTPFILVGAREIIQFVRYFCILQATIKYLIKIQLDQVDHNVMNKLQQMASKALNVKIEVII